MTLEKGFLRPWRLPLVSTVDTLEEYQPGCSHRPLWWHRKTAERAGRFLKTCLSPYNKNSVDTGKGDSYRQMSLKDAEGQNNYPKWPAA